MLNHPGHEVWTEVRFADREPFDLLYLWLACALPNALSRMDVTAATIDSGLVRPPFPSFAMASFIDADLAYLTFRRPTTGRNEAVGAEFGVIGHGPAGSPTPS